ncbi:MATH domain and coiled-coil domain-containing protein At3g58270-like [Vicia villosa]|uniref:MATH domain and coiled-coil domain-containing protein At3g58270-like n=1 Tax=Vicia villosa TaxID=3911 RepID=UPI00273C92D5|nr:MATH domain and coiled-coil domain-containing protein At3g58270-like [Vicia villosa]
MDNHKGKSINFEPFVWKIENFSKQNTKNLRSKSFRIGGYKWRILLHPLSKNVEHFSLYLMVADSLPAYGWSRKTHFKLVLVNQTDDNKSVVKETHQKFNGGYRSWGSFFLNLSDFHDTKQGYLVNNTCIIEVHINVQASSQIESSKQEQGVTETSDESSTIGSFDSNETGTPDLTLRDLLDLDSLGDEEASFIPLLEEACIWHPSLIRSQSKRTQRFKSWAFSSLGQVLHILKTSKVKDMNEEVSDNLRGLWEELVMASGFNLDWLEPYVESALSMRKHLERTLKVNELKGSIVDLENKMRKLRGELAEAEVEFEEAKKVLNELNKGYIDIDLNADLSYNVF